jgi:hypothetical protein
MGDAPVVLDAPYLPLLSPDEIYRHADGPLLQNLREDRRIERKSCRVDRRVVGDYFSMWANTKPSGGLLAIGIENDGSLAFLLSGGIGVNPYSSLADFFAGATLRFGAFNFSPLVHWGHDTRLTNGVYLGEELGNSPPALPTEKYWVKKLGIGVTVRLPVK